MATLHSLNNKTGKVTLLMDFIKGTVLCTLCVIPLPCFLFFSFSFGLKSPPVISWE